MAISKFILSADLVNHVTDLIEKGRSPSEIKSFLSEHTGFKKTKTRDIYKQIVDALEKGETILPVSRREEEAWEAELVSEAPYFFNEKSRQYIVFLKRAGKNIVISENTHKTILEAYSNWDGDPRTVNQICRIIKFPRALLEEYLRIFGITHDSLPVTAEDFDSQNIDELAANLKEKREFALIQKFEKESWEKTLKDAEQWQRFQFGVLNPFERAIENFQFPKEKSCKFKIISPSSKHLLVNIADIHVGLKADARYLYFQKEWNTQLLQEAMFKYTSKIKASISERKFQFESAIVCFGGDILHTLTGSTDKGTPLEYECITENQLDYAFTILIGFLENLLKLFPVIKVKSVQGNHSSLGDYTISRFLESYYRNEPRINFETTTKRFLPFIIADYNLFILEHGYSPKYKSKLPRAANARDSYIQNVLLEKPELLQGIRNRYYITNDQHHLEVQERNQFEMILCPSLVGGDRYSDNSMFNARPRQNAFIIDQEGIKEILHIYFD